MGELLLHRRNTSLLAWLVLAVGLFVAGVPCSASPGKPETLADVVLLGAPRHPAVIDRIVDGVYVVFLVGPEQEEWVGVLADGPSAEEAGARVSGDGLTEAGTVLFRLVAGEELLPGIWGVLEPPVPLPPTSVAPRPHFFVSHPQGQADGDADVGTGADPPGGPAVVLVFRPSAELTRQARDRVAARLAQLRARGPVLTAGAPEPPAPSFNPGCGPAAAGGPAWPQSALERAGWPPGPLPPTAAGPHPIPF